MINQLLLKMVNQIPPVCVSVLLDIALIKTIAEKMWFSV